MSQDRAPPPFFPKREPSWTPLPPEKRPKAAFTLAATLTLSLFLWASWALPVSRALEPLPQPAILYVTADGKPIARRGFYKAEPVEADRLPEHMVEAIVAIEDRRFWRHWGVDLRGVARALRTNAREGEVVQGGSTLTQQLAKTSFLGPERTLRRKAQEAMIALWLEARLSKEQILNRYLSSVYFGDGAYGLRAAARHYYGKEPEDLGLGEAATLAGLVKAPSRLNPRTDWRASRERARLVLAAMVEQGMITEAEARRARFPRPVDKVKTPAGSWFVDWVDDAEAGARRSRYGEATVQTTLDSRLQAAAERAVRTNLNRYSRSRNVTQGALVALRCDGSVAAMVGGYDYKKSQFNRATQAERQPGSAFKLFVYGAALRAGRSPETPAFDRPIQVADWKPENHEGRYAGLTTLRSAFARSSNAVAVQVQESVGRGAVVDMARDLGVEGRIGQDPALALGTYEVNLLELTAAYAAFRTGAYPIAPFGAGERPRPSGRFLDVDRVQRPMVEMLNAVVTEGSGGRAAFGKPAFGKTGTTQDHRDANFIGFAQDLVVGVWVGNDDRAPMRKVTGGELPAEIWRDFMRSADRRGLLQTGDCPPLPAPVQRAPVDPFPQVWAAADLPPLYGPDDLPYGEFAPPPDFEGYPLPPEAGGGVYVPPEPLDLPLPLPPGEPGPGPIAVAPPPEVFAPRPAPGEAATAPPYFPEDGDDEGGDDD